MTKYVSVSMMRLILALFFCALGLASVLPNVNEPYVGLKSGLQWLEVVFGVIELACGVFLLLSSFISATSKTVFAVTLIILIFWLARVALTRFVWGLYFVEGGAIDFPKFLNWLLILLPELVIATGLSIVLKANEQA